MPDLPRRGTGFDGGSIKRGWNFYVILNVESGNVWMAFPDAVRGRQMRRSPIEEGKRWLEQVLEDPDAARYNLEGGKFYLVCFLCQQLSEKAIKAFLYSRGEEIVLGHSVVSLCERASRYDPGFTILRRESPFQSWDERRHINLADI
jgi:hypothetical protein